MIDPRRFISRGFLWGTLLAAAIVPLADSRISLGQPLTSQDYELYPHDTNAGGNHAQSDDYGQHNTLGQGAGIGRSDSESYRVDRGLWPVFVQRHPTPTPTFTPTATFTPTFTPTPTPTPTPTGAGVATDSNLIFGAFAGSPRGAEIFGSVTLAELDGDEDPELVFGTDRTGNNDSGMGVFAINMDGTKVAGVWPVIYNVDIRTSPAVADLDGDGLDEVVVGTYGAPNTLRILDHNGTQIGSAQANFSIVSSPAIADLDDDGDLEIVVGTSDERILAVNSDGSPAEGAWPVTIPPPSRRLLVRNDIDSSPAVGDLDGDGLPEIVILSDEGVVYAYHGDGQPVAGFPFEAPRDSFAIPLDTSANSASVLLADVDGDSSLDVVVAMSNGRIYALRADGSQIEGFPLRLPPGFPLEGRARPGDNILSTPAVGDLDGDGLLELAVTFYDGPDDESRLYVYDLAASANLTAPYWPTLQSDTLRSGHYYGPRDGDIDGNGLFNGNDLQGFGPTWYRTQQMPRFVPELDLDYSERIDGVDLNRILEQTRQGVPPGGIK